MEELIRTVDYEPWWSPDATGIVFVSNRNGPLNLYRLSLTDRSVTRLTHHAGPDDTPAWSPDGRWIAFVSEVDGNAELYLVAADGSGLRRLTDHPGVDLHPTWAADSLSLLFNTSRFAADPSNPDRIDVCAMRLDGSDLRCHTAGGINTYASWSPDGSTLLFRRSRGEGKSQVVLLQPETGMVSELTPGEHFDGWPSWSADGSRIVFASDRSGEFHLYVIDRAGGAATRLTSRAGRFTNPRWSPRAGRLLFTGRAAGDADLEIYVMPAPPPPAGAGSAGSS